MRPVANYGLPEWLRVTVGLPAENARFLAALAKALATLSRARRRRRDLRHSSHAKLVVVGVGLIGGSFALALRAAGRGREVVGVGRTPRQPRRARWRAAIVDRALTLDADWTRESPTRTSCCIATPVAQIAALLRSDRGRTSARATVVTDAGSTKEDVVAAARAAFGAELPQFVPGPSDRRHRAHRRGRGVRRRCFAAATSC